MPNNSPSEPQNELKGGHKPAVKVGNMRVTQRTHSTSSTHSDKGDGESGAAAAGECSKGAGDVPSACSFAPKQVVKEQTGGVPENVLQSVPEAVRQFHEKPQPSHDFRNHSSKPNVIQQPKK